MRKKTEGDAFVGLHERTKNMLHGFGLKNKEDVLNALKEGWLSPARDGLPNYGPETHKEVYEWLNSNEQRDEDGS